MIGEPSDDPLPGQQPAEGLEDVVLPLPAGTGTHASAPAPSQPRPESLKELFLAFNWLALQGFGGVLPVAQRELVERHRWLTREQFVELLAVCQVLPGPNVVNLALAFGDRVFGMRGAVAALSGMLLVPSLIVLTLTALYGHFAQIPAVSGALRGMGAVAAGLIIATALKLLGTLRRNPLGLGFGLGLAALMGLGTAWLHWPLIWLILGLGLVACGLAWKRLPP